MVFVVREIKKAMVGTEVRQSAGSSKIVSRDKSFVFCVRVASVVFASRGELATCCLLSLRQREREQVTDGADDVGLVEESTYRTVDVSTR